MRNKLLILFVLLYFQGISQDKVPVFVSGTNGYNTFRIPAIIRLSDGGLLAFCEGRVNASRDFGDIDIVMRKSIDNGKTWTAIKKVVDYDNLQAGNPAPVVDITDPMYPEGRLFLFYNTGNNHEGEIRSGNGIREVWYKTSADGGDTWSEPVNITPNVHRPNKLEVNPGYNYKEDWRSYANTPGHALQFTSGKYKGRIYVAANHSSGNPLPQFQDYNSHGYFTDDHGKTFQLAESLNLAGSNEATAAELSEGKLMLNARNQKGDNKTRIVAISKNGGENWESVRFDKNLPDPVCEGAILNIGKRKGKMILAFCNAADTVQRNNLTLRISYNEGKTWHKKILIEKQEDKKKDATAYSDIVKLADRKIGVLYERNNYAEIVFFVTSY